MRTRRYHALLLAATKPPAARVVLVNGLEAWVETGSERLALTSHCYQPDVIHPDGWRRIAAFRRTPWPTWSFALPGGAMLEYEVLVARDSCDTVLRWRVSGAPGKMRLFARPLMSGRDYHALHHENAAFDFAAKVQGGNVVWRPYRDLPAIAALSNGVYESAPLWYRDFLYTAERDRGLEDTEDLASPGVFAWDLGADAAVLVLRTGDGLNLRASAYAEMLTRAERARRTSLVSPLASAADSYIIDRGRGRTILAGFPWFTDWGRDTFIALRGLALATGRHADAERILDAWAGTVSQGMLPNRFPDSGDTPEYNSVDASLWFVVAVHEFLRDTTAARYPVEEGIRARLRDAVEAILQGYVAGTRYAIGVDADGLVRAGVAGLQLTWMDAKVGDWVVTPRIGKPVEVQALWINALRIGAEWSSHWTALERQARASFARFADPETGGLVDVIDADHVPGAVDRSIRPNQIFAVGGLPFPLLEGDAARGVVGLVERTLLTPMGLRSLARSDPAYVPHYRGGQRERDGGYHQGTVWPWLAGPFVEAWLRVQGDDDTARTRARERFLAPLLAHLETAGLGHVSEVADGDPPHLPGGCPFQAWSLGELIRIEKLLAPAPQDRSEIAFGAIA